MAKPNYRFDKRQREMIKDKQQEEKRLKKLARKEAEVAASAESPEPLESPDVVPPIATPELS